MLVNYFTTHTTKWVQILSEGAFLLNIFIIYSIKYDNSIQKVHIVPDDLKFWFSEKKCFVKLVLVGLILSTKLMQTPTLMHI